MRVSCDTRSGNHGWFFAYKGVQRVSSGRRQMTALSQRAHCFVEVYASRALMVAVVATRGLSHVQIIYHQHLSCILRFDGSIRSQGSAALTNYDYGGAWSDRRVGNPTR